MDGASTENSDVEDSYRYGGGYGTRARLLRFAAVQAKELEFVFTRSCCAACPLQACSKGLFDHTCLELSQAGATWKETKIFVSGATFVFPVKKCDHFWNGIQLSGHLCLWSRESLYASQGLALTVNCR